MKKAILIALGVIALVAIGLIGWWVSTYNGLIVADQGVKAAWSQVENQYQRRYDLIPNLVETVKGFAKQEQAVLVGVTEARSRVGQLTVTPEVLRDPEAFARFQQAQDGLSSALSRLMVVMEQYPALKSDQNFLSLQSQLEGTENRISVERRRYNDAVQSFNVRVKTFPASFVASASGFSELAYFTSSAGAEAAPEVRF